jgi:acetylornithine/succinyldiaminopimelate/putrescine aminotransferase
VLGKSMRPKDSLMFITKRPDVTFVRGEGSYLYDEQGARYLDFVQGWAVNSLGHSPQVVRHALNEQASLVVNVSPAYYNDPMCRLAELLAELSGLNRVFFANSGAEANEGAIKLVRKWGSVKRNGAYEIITFDGDFLATVRENGSYLESRLQDLSRELNLGEVRGRGLLIALELGREIGSAIVETAFSRGLLVNSPRPAVLRFMPALNISRAEIDEMVNILHEAISSVH